MPIRIIHDHYIHHVGGTPGDVTLNDLHTRLGEVLAQGATIMASQDKADIALADLDIRLTNLGEVVDSVVAADQAEDDAFRAEIQRLKDQIAAGEAVTQAQLDAIAEGITSRSSKLTEVSDFLKHAGTNASQPIPPVEIEPVPEPTPEP